MSGPAKLFRQALLLPAAFALLVSGPWCLPQAQAAEKIPLRILYAGKPESAREADFVAFLKQHFREVNTAPRAELTAQEAAKPDVILLDWDGDGFKAPRVRLPEDFAGPVVTIGVAGALFCDHRRLKTGYT